MQLIIQDPGVGIIKYVLGVPIIYLNYMNKLLLETLLEQWINSNCHFFKEKYLVNLSVFLFD